MLCAPREIAVEAGATGEEAVISTIREGKGEGGETVATVGAEGATATVAAAGGGELACRVL